MANLKIHALTGINNGSVYVLVQEWVVDDGTTLIQREER